jgi:secretion/DNA translocation related TadE-like protein
MDRDRGSVTVWVVGFVALVWLAATAATAYGGAVIGRHRAGTAADLTALAAAMHVLDGESAACSVAADVAGRNGAVLRICRVAGADVEVEVARSVDVAGVGMHTAVARARAGPVDGGGAMP